MYFLYKNLRNKNYINCYTIVEYLSLILYDVITSVGHSGVDSCRGWTPQEDETPLLKDYISFSFLQYQSGK